MKTILIERVSNGWIVRPFSPCSDWARAENPAIAVYTELSALQSDLPALLGEPSRESIALDAALRTPPTPATAPAPL